MPQVRGKDIPDMLKELDNNGIVYKNGSLAVNIIKPVQEDGVSSKVDSIVSDLQSGKQLPPIVMSQDGWIIDGRHRWLACKKLYGDDYKMKVIMILLPKIDALVMFDKVADEII